MSELRTIDVSQHAEKKGKFTYLSWAFAVDSLITAKPDATWEVKHFPMMVLETIDVIPEETEDGKKLTYIRNLKAVPEMQVPYMRTDCGYFVEVAVTVDGITRTQVHPVLDHSNKPVASPTNYEINTSIMRCLAKAIALHGLGLYIYAGEDLPPSPPHRFKRGEAAEIQKQVREALGNGDEVGLKQILDEYLNDDPEEVMKFWALFNSTERSTIKKLTGE